MSIEKLLKALANRRRLAIVKKLSRTKMMNVGEIASDIRLSLKATSRHLSILSHADILEYKQIGLNKYYFLSKPPHEVTNTILNYIPNSHE